MEFVSLHADNFMRLKDVTLPLQGKGLVLVLGDNRDAEGKESNGAGKSSLLEAFCWALWGQTVRGLSGDDVVNTDVGKNCVVEVVFKERGTTYRVQRTRKYALGDKPNDLKVYANDKDISGPNIAATQDILNQVLNLDFVTFQCMMPGAGLKAAQLTDAKIKDLLEKLLQTELIAKAHILAKSKVKEVEAKVALLLSEQEKAEADVQQAKQRIAQYQAGSDGFEESKASRVATNRDRQAQVQESLKSLVAQVSVLPKLEEDLSRAQATQVTLAAGLQEMRKEESLAVTRESGRVTSIKEDSWKTQHQISHVQKLLAESEALGGVCPTCSQQVSKELKASFSSVHKEELASLATILEEHRRKEESAQRQLEATKTEFKARVAPKAVELAGVEDLIASLKESLASLRAKTNQVLYLKKEFTNLLSEEASILSEENLFDSLIREEESAVAATEVSISSRKIELAYLAKELESLEFWVKGFSARGLRSFMLQNVTPILNARSKHYSELLSGGDMQVVFHTQRTLKSGAVKEDFNIEVRQEDGHSSYTGSSSGERSRADLVVSFSLGDLAYLRSDKQVSFRFLDEPFEHIDQVGKSRIVHLLREQQEEYDTVFCITHDPHLQDLFEQTLKVVKKDGTSTLQWEDR